MKNLITLLICLWATLAHAQFDIKFNINTNQDKAPISPLIYGSNAHSDDRDEHITSRRLGGNRMTGYNWETNFSHAGTDWNNQNDHYLPGYFKLPEANNGWLMPNLVIKAFQDSSLAMDCYSLVTLPMAGYVAADKNGPVLTSEVAPSARFKIVKNKKGSAFNLNPDTSDDAIYVDECMNNLIATFGLSSTSNGIKGYSMDNEYALWQGTHPRIHPTKPTIAEVIQKSSDLAKTIKTMDPQADVFGPADYGFSSYYYLDNAPDWNNYKQDSLFINSYLKGMKQASDAFGSRLLDVLDMHWYPEAKGKNSLGNFQRVTSVNAYSNDKGVAEARMQSPRTLWDPTYVENSWIGTSFSPCVYLTSLKKNIDKYYPGTKLAFTEFDYGGNDHISGGIATADVLGLFGKYGVYAAMHWESLDKYLSAAYKIYRNYDGHKSTFGDLNINASSTDYALSSIYASLKSKDLGEMHVIAMNKHYDESMQAVFEITSDTEYSKIAIYKFDKDSYVINSVNEIPVITGNKFTYTIPPLSVYHFVLQSEKIVPQNQSDEGKIGIYPNPGKDMFKISLPDTEELISISVVDILGRVVYHNQDKPNSEFDMGHQSPGVYFVSLETKNSMVTKKIIKE